MAEIKTERLFLRKIKNGDIFELIEGMNNSDITKFLVGVPSPYTRENAEKWVEECNKEPNGIFYLGIELRGEKKFIGEIGLSPMDFTKGSGELAYWLLLQYQGKGYASEALKAFIDYSFKDLKLKELEASFFLDNIPSRKLIKKLGFVRDKRLRLCKSAGRYEAVYRLKNPQNK